MPAALGAWNVTLAGIPLKIIKDPTKADDPNASAGFSGQWVTQDSTKTLERRDVPVPVNQFRRGAGFLRRRGPQDDGGLAWVENGFFHTDQGITHSGYLQAASISLAQSSPAVVDSRSFLGARYCITTSGLGVRFPNDDPTQAAVFDPPLNTGAWANATTSFRAGYVCTAMEVFAAANGEPALYIATYNNSVPATRLYQYTASAGWAESAAFTGFRIDKLVGPVWWEDGSGAGAQRLLAATTSLSGGPPSATGFVANIIRHVALGNNPLDPAQWVTPISLAPGFGVTKLLAFPEFGYAVTPRGIYTFNATRAMNLTPYWRDGSSYTDGTVTTTYYHGIVAARGFGLDYYDARQDYRRQDESYEVGPMAGMQDGTPIRGLVTGLVQYEGALIQALYNHQNDTTYIGRSYPREKLNIDYPNPFVHYWAEQVITPSAGPVGHQVTHLAVSSPTVSSTTIQPNRPVYLWMFLSDEPYDAGSQFDLNYAPLPSGSGPLSFQASGGTSFAYNQTMKAYLTAQDWDDTLATKFIRKFDFVSNQVSSIRTLTLSTRVDQDPTTITDQSTWTAAGSAVITDAGSIVPSPAVSGKSIGLQVITSTTSGAGQTKAPVFMGISPRAKVVRQSLKAMTLYAVCQKGQEMADGSADVRDTNDVLDAVNALQDVGAQSYVNPEGATKTVLVEQGQVFDTEYLEDGEPRVTIKIDLSEVV
jgi:hypothetical protein